MDQRIKEMSTGNIGTVKFFTEKGWGFISSDVASEGDVFVHKNQVAQGIKLCEGDRVSYDVIVGKQGKPAAQNVRLVGDTPVQFGGQPCTFSHSAHAKGLDHH